MVLWYRRSFSQNAYVRAYAAVGLSFCMLLNVISLLNFAAVLGFPNWALSQYATYVPVPLAAALLIANLLYAFAPIRRAAAP